MNVPMRWERKAGLPSARREPPAFTASGVPRRNITAPVSRFGALVASRSAALFLFAVLSWFASDVDGRTGSVVLVVAACIQPIVAAVAGRSGAIRGSFVAHDILLPPLVVVAAPSYFWPMAIVLVSLMAIHAVVLPLSRYVAVAVAVPVLIAIAGVLTGTDFFERAAGLAAVLAVAYGFIGNQLHSAAVASKRDLLFAVDAAGGFTHVTRLGEGLIEISGDVEQVVGWPRREWMTMDQFKVVHPDDHDRFEVNADDVVAGQILDRTGRVRTKDGRWIWLRDVSRVVETDGHTELHGFTVDVTAQQVGLDRVTAEATTDPLTGLANRRALVSELTDLAESAGHHLVLIDLNRFKEVNDTLGHEAGDALLRVVGDRILESISERDFLSRLGGDEFAIVHRGEVETDDIVSHLDALASVLAQPVEINGVHVSTSISAGIVRARRSQADSSTMLRHADMAMYAAKRERRTSVVFDDRMGDHLEQRLALSTQADDALLWGEIVLHYQAIVDARSGRITGVEGLARWEHPRLGLLTPDAFLDVILLSERSGDFTRCMVEQAIGSAAHFGSLGHPIPVSVNVPVRSVEDGDFESWFVAACRSASVPPERIVFEVAERDLHDAIATVEAIDRLSDIGVGIAVDDFGTGHATFDRLRWRNVSQIKLDRDIINSSATDVRDGIIVRSIIDLAHSLGYSVVAEGVEDLDQLRALREMGCNGVQGYLFSPPVPRDEFGEILERGPLGPIGQSSPLTSLGSPERSAS